jgi:alginate O-acetyltransferase complex protein AlgI
MAGYSVVYKVNRMRTVYLLLVSLFFYFKTSGVFLVLLLFTICSDFLWGNLIHKSSSKNLRKFFLGCSVVINLLLLCYFKYSYFFHESFNSIFGSDRPFINHFTIFSNHFFGTAFSVDKLLLPVGVSFFTFQSLSYTIDMYRQKIEPVKNVFDYGFFVCFFPHLVAGPIVKAHDFLYQVYQPYHLSRLEFGLAVFWIMNGFCKKIIADYIAVNFVDRIFDNPGYYSGLEIVFGVFGYSLQIYMDFSGYTDIAIGLALLLGYRLKINFNSPYKATSTTEFWKRWHISLSSWLKEYLYIPLGGNREGTFGSYVCIVIILSFMILLSGKIWLLAVFAIISAVVAVIACFWGKFLAWLNTNINLMVTMLLGGLWHGSSWLFLIWGGLNGLGLIIHKAWSRISPFKDNEALPVRALLIFVTLTFISYTRIYFRSADLQVVDMIYDRILNHFSPGLFLKIISGYRVVFVLMLIGYTIHWIPESMKENYRHWFASRNLVTMGSILVLLVFVMYQLMGSEMQPFIYFQF